MQALYTESVQQAPGVLSYPVRTNAVSKVSATPLFCIKYPQSSYNKNK